jgi:hypothetical protein
MEGKLLFRNGLSARACKREEVVVFPHALKQLKLKAARPFRVCAQTIKTLGVRPPSQLQTLFLCSKLQQPNPSQISRWVAISISRNHGIPI